MSPAPEDCPECDKPTLRDGVCSSCGFSVPRAPRPYRTNPTVREIGLRGVEAARRELENNAETET